MAKNKLYYNIGEVAEITALQTYTLRSWEKEFKNLRPKRSRGKNRAYRAKDISIIFLLKSLLYTKGYTIKGAKEKLKNNPEMLNELPLFKPFEFKKSCIEDYVNNWETSIKTHTMKPHVKTEQNVDQLPLDYDPHLLSQIKDELNAILKLL